MWIERCVLSVLIRTIKIQPIELKMLQEFGLLWCYFKLGRKQNLIASILFHSRDRSLINLRGWRELQNEKIVCPKLFGPNYPKTG